MQPLGSRAQGQVQQEHLPGGSGEDEEVLASGSASPGALPTKAEVKRSSPFCLPGLLREPWSGGARPGGEALGGSVRLAASELEGTLVGVHSDILQGCCEGGKEAQDRSRRSKCCVVADAVS